MLEKYLLKLVFVRIDLLILVLIMLYLVKIVFMNAVVIKKI